MKKTVTKKTENRPQAQFPQLGNADERTPVYWWHWVIGVALTALLVFLSPRGKSPEFASLTEGSVSQRKVIAPFDFEILKPTDELEKERQEAVTTVLPVLTASDSVKVRHVQELRALAKLTEDIITETHASLLAKTGSKNFNLTAEDSVFIRNGGELLFNRFGFRISFDTWRFLISLYQIDRIREKGIYRKYFERQLIGILNDIYNQGVINVPKDSVVHRSGQVAVDYKNEETVQHLKRLLTTDEALKRIPTLLSAWLDEEKFPRSLISGSYDILQSFVTPNIIYDEVETKHRRDVAFARVPLARGFVKKDELIIAPNIRVTKEHVEILNSLAKKRAEMELDKGWGASFLQIGSQFLLMMFVILTLFVFIAVARREIWSQWKLMLLVAIILGMIHTFQALVLVKNDLPRYLFPAAMGAMLLIVLVDRSVALAGIVVMALIAGLIRGNDFPTVFISVMVGGVALLAMKRVQTRVDVMRVGIYLLGVYFALLVSFHFIHFTAEERLLTDTAFASVNAIVSPMLVLGLVIVFENLFGITTNLSLLELVDLNRPLLRELAIKSPGTYHHSILVGSLAESAAREIGANALLTRAGAYYHDIGKMENREYFIENQETGSFNIHDRLAPVKSAEVVIGHVKQGLELADKYRLPPQVKAFISGHHGRSRLAYFFAKAVNEEGEDIDDTKFRYPGPNPQTRETGILMLADTIEAATRSMSDHSIDDIRSTVEKLIRNRIADGDLEDCPLTLKEITRIQETFVKVLAGIYHQRIAYPEQDKTVDSSVKGKSGVEPTPVTQINNPTQKQV